MLWKSQIGRIALAMGYVKASDVADAVDAQDLGIEKPLGEILLQLGALTEDELNEVIDTRDAENPDWQIAPRTHLENMLFATAGVRKGYLSDVDIAVALRKAETSSPPSTLETNFKSSGDLSPEQIDDVLRLRDREDLICSVCRHTSFPFDVFKEGALPVCDRCGGEYRIVDPPLVEAPTLSKQIMKGAETRVQKKPKDRRKSTGIRIPAQAKRTPPVGTPAEPSPAPRPAPPPETKPALEPRPAAHSPEKPPAPVPLKALPPEPAKPPLPPPEKAPPPEPAKAPPPPPVKAPPPEPTKPPPPAPAMTPPRVQAKPPAPAPEKAPPPEPAKAPPPPPVKALPPEPAKPPPPAPAMTPPRVQAKPPAPAPEKTPPPEPAKPPSPEVVELPEPAPVEAEPPPHTPAKPPRMVRPVYGPPAEREKAPPAAPVKPPSPPPAKPPPPEAVQPPEPAPVEAKPKPPAPAKPPPLVPRAEETPAKAAGDVIPLETLDDLSAELAGLSKPQPEGAPVEEEDRVSATEFRSVLKEIELEEKPAPLPAMREEKPEEEDVTPPRPEPRPTPEKRPSRVPKPKPERRPKRAEVMPARGPRRKGRIIAVVVVILVLVALGVVATPIVMKKLEERSTVPSPSPSPSTTGSSPSPPPSSAKGQTPKGPPSDARLEVRVPQGSELLKERRFVVQGRCDPTAVTNITVGSKGIAPDASGSFRMNVDLFEGENRVTVTAKNGETVLDNRTFRVVVDSMSPRITVEGFPASGRQLTKERRMSIRGKIEDAHPGKVAVDGANLPMDETGKFRAEVSLDEGENRVVLRAVDRAGNESSSGLVIVRDAT
ncbi:MAG: hypothetical protein ACYS47_17865, partial [Planctomycetota bacterium]